MHGLNADATDGAYTKNAAKLFMYAAGVYAHLRNNVATRVGGALTSEHPLVPQMQPALFGSFPLIRVHSGADRQKQEEVNLEEQDAVEEGFVL